MASPTVTTKKYVVDDHPGAAGAVKVSPGPLGNSATTTPSSSSDVPLPAIIGGSVAGLILIGIVALGVYIWYRRKYPVRMVLGKDFQRFSNPAYSTKKMSTLKLVVEDPLAAYDVPLEQINEGFDPDDGDRRAADPSEPHEHTIDVSKVPESKVDSSNEATNVKEFPDEVESDAVPQRKKSKQAILVKSEDFESFEVINEFDNSFQDEACPDVDAVSDETSVKVSKKGLDSNVASMDMANEISTQDESDSIDVHGKFKQENDIENEEEVEPTECIPLIEGENNPTVDHQLSAHCGEKESTEKEVNGQSSAEQLLSDDPSDRDFLDAKEPVEMFDNDSNIEKKGELENLDDSGGLSASFIVLEKEEESQTDRSIDNVNDTHEDGKLETPVAHLNEQLGECPNTVSSVRLTDEWSLATDEIGDNSSMLMADDSKQTLEITSIDSLLNTDKSETQILGSHDSPTKGEQPNGANSFNSHGDIQRALEIPCDNAVHEENIVKIPNSRKSHRLSADHIVLERPPPTPTVVYDSIILEPDLSNFDERVDSFPDVREHRSSTFDLVQNSTKIPSSLKPRRSFDEYNSLATTLSDSFQSLISNKSMDHKQSSNTDHTIDISPESRKNGTEVNNEGLVNEFVCSTDENLNTKNVFDTTPNEADADVVNMVTDETNKSTMETDDKQKVDDTFDYLQSMSIHRMTDNNENIDDNMKVLNNEPEPSSRILVNFASDDNESKHDAEKKLDTSSKNPVLFSSVETEYDFLKINSENTMDGAKSEDSGRQLLLNFDLPDFSVANTGTSDQNSFDFSHPFQSFENIEVIPSFGEGNTVTTGFSKAEVNVGNEELEEEKDQDLLVFSNMMKAEGSEIEPESSGKEFKEIGKSHLDFDTVKQSVKSRNSTTEVEPQNEEPDTHSDFTVSTESSSSKSWEIVTDSLVNLNENTDTSDRSATEHNETKLLKIDASGFNFDDIDDKSGTTDEDKESLEIISEDESNA